jgi:hypothetical protein
MRGLGGRKVEDAGFMSLVMKDELSKVEEIEVSHTLGGVR